jgi:hypothetical protein
VPSRLAPGVRRMKMSTPPGTGLKTSGTLEKDPEADLLDQDLDDVDAEQRDDG